MQISEFPQRTKKMPLLVVYPRRRINGAAPIPQLPPAATTSGIPSTAPANDAGRRPTVLRKLLLIFLLDLVLVCGIGLALMSIRYSTAPLV